MAEKVVLAIVAILLILLLGGNLLPDVVTDVASESYSEPYTVVTGSGVTNTTETLSFASYYDDLQGITASSNDTGDSPVIMSYDSTTYDVLVAGLQASTTRILTLTYLRDSHQEYTGFSGFIRMIPLIVIIAGVFFGLWLLFSWGKKRWG